MKQKKTLSILALTLIMVGCFALGASASGALQEIKAYLDPTINVEFNGEPQTMLDANGGRVYPITYNGTTYVPVRAVGNMFDVKVDWDGSTRTVVLGERDGRTDLLAAFKPYTKYATSHSGLNCGVEFIQNASKPRDVGGVTLDHWLSLWNNGYDRGADQLTASFNLGGKYATLTFQVYTNVDTTLTVSGDNGSVLGQYNLVGGQTPQSVTVNLLNTTQLTFERGTAPDGSPFATAVNTYIFDAHVE